MKQHTTAIPRHSLKTLCAAMLLLAALPARAQHIEAGIHGGYGTTWLLNSNVSDQGDNADYAATFSPVIGVQGHYAFNSKLGIVLGIDYAPVQQKYKGTVSGQSFEVRDKLNYIDIPVLARLQAGGIYLELGPKLSFLTGAQEIVESTSAGITAKDHDIKSNYKSVVISAAFGIGKQFRVAENLYGDVSIRLSYGLSDATEELSLNTLSQKTASNEISVGGYYAHIDQKGNYAYTGTHAATGHLLAGLSYRFAAAADKGAKKKKK